MSTFRFLQLVSRMSRPKFSLPAMARIAYLLLGAALLLLLGFSLWTTYQDVRTLRSTLLDSRLALLRAHAERTVGRLESLHLDADVLTQVVQQPWIREHWGRPIADLPQRYAAIVDASGRVIMHSDSKFEGRRLSRHWYQRAIPGTALEVVETKSAALVGGVPSLDIRVPIVHNGRELGEYHAGFDLTWFRDVASQASRELLIRRSAWILTVVVLVCLGSGALYYLATHSLGLREAVETASVARTAELSQLAAGLAHEIRNPLHAIRLNLHTFRRAQESRAELSSSDIAKMLDESAREVDRIDRLMQDLMGFATVNKPRDSHLDLGQELQDIVDFLDQEMVDHGIEVDLSLPNREIDVHMDPGRLRQIMLNLMHNAVGVLHSGGRISVSLEPYGKEAVIKVADNGPGVAERDRSRIFEPFFSQREGGTGLGLALVRRYVEDSDGEIHCSANPEGGTVFSVVLPLSNHTGRKP